MSQKKGEYERIEISETELECGKCGDLCIHESKLPIINVEPNEKMSWLGKITVMLIIIVLLTIAVVVKYYLKYDYSSSASSSSSSNIKNYTEVMEINIGSIPMYLRNILSKLRQLSLEYMDINQSLSKQFVYGYKYGYNESQSNQCYYETLKDLTKSYEYNQLYMINLLFPVNYSHINNHNKNSNIIDNHQLSILGGYGGGFQIYCNGNMLINIGGGASLIDNRYPSFLDIEDLIDMNILSIHNTMIKGGGGIQLYMKNIKYIKQKYQTHVSVNFIQYWNNTMDIYKNGLFVKYLKIIWEEINVCYTNNFPFNNLSTGLYLFGGGGGNAMNKCDYSDILGDAFFYDYYASK